MKSERGANETRINLGIGAYFKRREMRLRAYFGITAYLTKET